MKVIRPTALVAEAAEVLAPVRDHVVLVGAAALAVALADSLAAITPTVDVDLVVGVERAAEVVRQLENADFERSTLPHERAFTWVRGDVRVQLVRDFHPHPKQPAKALPENPVFGMAAVPAHQELVAFEADPMRARLLCVRPLCLLALKQAAFGRLRGPERLPVERDYHDAHLLLRHAEDALVADVRRASHEVKTRARSALDLLLAGGDATQAAGRQMVRVGEAATQRDAEAEVQQTAMRVRRVLFPQWETGPDA